MGKNGFWLENSRAGSDFESWLNVPSNILLSFLFFMCTKSDSLLVSIKYLEDGKNKKKKPNILFCSFSLQGEHQVV